MASPAKKRRNSKKATSTETPEPLISATALRRLRQLSLLAGALGSTYLVIAMSTYSAQDPAFSHTGAGPVENAAGPAGAWLADVVFQVFGYGAWALSSLVVVFGLKMGGKKLGGMLGLFAAALSLWSVLTAMALVAPGTEAVAFPPGGYIGLLSAEALSAVIGPAGTWILVAFCLLGAAPFVLGVDLEDIVAGTIRIVESKLPHAAGGVLARLTAITASTTELTRSGLGHARHRLANALPRKELTGPIVGSESDGRMDIAMDGPSVGGIPTPTQDEAEVFASFAGVMPDLPTEEEENPDPTVFQVPDLVEVEWGTEHGIEPSEAVGPETVAPPTADPISLDAALLAAAIDAPEPSFAHQTNSGILPSDPGVPSTAELESDIEPGLLSDPESAPTLPPLDEPVVNGEPALSDEPAMAEEPALNEGPVTHEERSLELAPPTGSGFGPEVTPGELVSGGTEDDGRAIVIPEIKTPFVLPHLDLLDNHPRDVASFDEHKLRQLGATLETKLLDFGVKGEVVAIRPGPVITTFEYLPAPGVKVSKIAGLQDDIAMALKALRVRIIAPIPGKGVVGIEIPNDTRQTVWIRDMLASESFRNETGALPMALGKSVDGKPRVADLAKMPHLLVGGTTGSGKSVGVNSMLLSLIYTRTPEELRLILVDPKMLEFEMYRDIPHLLHPVVTDPKLASAALKWACTEMDHRYRMLSQWKVRNIANYNAKLEREMEDWTPAKARKYAPPDWPENEPPPPPKRMPYLVIVIDELADLMMVAGKDVEESIIRIAQKARAAGIHLIVATQRPSVNVITGLIKANMPSRIAFQVRTKIDGRTILDQNGAEALLGKGDMLFLPPGVASLERLHGAFVSDDEVNGVTDFVREQASPVYEAQISADEGGGRTIDEDEYDELYDEAVAFICEAGKASSSMIQRKFKIGYNRAARIIDVMEQEGVIGAADGARPRQVLVGQTG